MIVSRLNVVYPYDKACLTSNNFIITGKRISPYFNNQDNELSLYRGCVVNLYDIYLSNDYLLYEFINGGFRLFNLVVGVHNGWDKSASLDELYEIFQNPVDISDFNKMMKL